MNTKRTPIEIRFWKKVKKGDPSQCWPWTARISPKGYGSFERRSRKRILGVYPGTSVAHRLAWELTFGPIPKGMECCHHCDNPPCCNPAHLYVGTHAQNMEDMRQRNHKAVKLSDDKVRDIRKRHECGVAIRALAREFSVSQRLIQFIVRGIWWKHVKQF